MSATLYEELGGREAIEAAVEEFYDRVLADESLEQFFEDVDADELRQHQVHFLTAATGGPDRYEGVNMADAHAHLGITDEDFDRVARHLDDALAACGVGSDDRERVLARVESLRSDVVSV